MSFEAKKRSKVVPVEGLPQGTQLLDAARDYITYLKVERGFSRATTDSYNSWLNHFIKWLKENGYPQPDLSAFNTMVLKRFFYELSGRGYRPRTLRSAFYPLIGMAKYLIMVGAIKDNPTASIMFPKKDAAQRLTVSEQEVASLEQAVDRYRSQRMVALSRAMLSVLTCCGVRATELIDLKVGDVSLGNRTLLVASGKGDKSRMLYPPAETLAAIKEWLQYREKDCRHDYLWTLDRNRRMGYNGLLHWLDEVKCMAGFRDHPNIKPHSLRHFFATRMHNNGAPIKSVQAALGHTDAQTTFVYLHLGEEQTKLMATYASSKPTAIQVEAENERPSGSDKHKAAKATFMRMRRSPTR